VSTDGADVIISTVAGRAQRRNVHQIAKFPKLYSSNRLVKLASWHSSTTSTSLSPVKFDQIAYRRYSIAAVPNCSDYRSEGIEFAILMPSADTT